ncbi:MAG TPA: alpha/beta fold hydrolase [archaeon]|nr:alpha/beta fold hydrolase [archaeon]
MSNRSRALTFALLPIILLSGCISIFQRSPAQQVAAPAEVTFLTDDGVTIRGTYYAGGNNSIILLHMLIRSRNDYNFFAKQLQQNGYSVLSIDFRGHGQSIPPSFNQIDDFNKLFIDVAAAKNFLAASKGKPADRISIIGASIGANIALRYAADNPSIRSIILLSPGNNYHDVTARDVIGKYQGKILIIAAADDGNGVAAQEATGIAVLTDKEELKIYEKGGHGTNLLGTNDVNKVILVFLSRVYS